MRRGVAIRVVGPLQWIVYPALAAAAGTLLLATPVKLFGLKLPEPILPMVLAFAWPLIRPSVLGPLVLFLLGLFLDVVLFHPLGLWPLALLMVYGLILGARSFLMGQDTLMLFVWYAGVVMAALLTVYAAAALIAGNAPSVLAFVMQALPTLLLFPLAGGMIARFDDDEVRLR